MRGAPWPLEPRALGREVSGSAMKPGLHWVFELPSFLLKLFETGLAERLSGTFPENIRKRKDKIHEDRPSKGT